MKLSGRNSLTSSIYQALYKDQLVEFPPSVYDYWEYYYYGYGIVDSVTLNSPFTSLMKLKDLVAGGKIIKKIL